MSSATTPFVIPGRPAALPQAEPGNPVPWRQSSGKALGSGSPLRIVRTGEMNNYPVTMQHKSLLFLIAVGGDPAGVPVERRGGFRHDQRRLLVSLQRTVQIGQRLPLQRVPAIDQRF